MLRCRQCGERLKPLRNKCGKCKHLAICVMCPDFEIFKKEADERCTTFEEE